MASAWSGRVLDVIKEKAPVALTYKESVAWGKRFHRAEGLAVSRSRDEIINYAITRTPQNALLPLADLRTGARFGSGQGDAGTRRKLLRVVPDESQGVLHLQ